ncbi:MAG: hypothetical protein ACYS6W_16515 [Planctomycetota bacterium]|jgi:hypothetical protein
MQKNKRTQLHKSTRPLITYALITYALMLTGCAKQQELQMLEQICVPAAAKADAMQAAEVILGKMHFTIDKADTEQGLIRTRPLPGAQFFEFWRSDNVGELNSAEANMHSIRRVAELNISPQGGQLCIGCNVNVQRLSMPEQQISSSARAYRLFSQSSPAMQRLILHPRQKKGMAWVNLGNDTMLATEILKRIEKHLKPEE